MSTTEGALHVREVAEGRSPLKPMSFFTDVVLLVVVRCVVSVKGVSPTTKTRRFLRGLSSTELPNTTGWVTTPGDEEGVPANAYIYVFVLWGGGAVRKQQHIFYKLPNEFPNTCPLQVGRSYHQIKVVKYRKT